MYGIIATWRMALEGISKADSMLKNNENAADSIEEAIKVVEDFEYYKSVGYGGLPNEEMEVELDAAFMDGDTLEFGCVGGIKDFANPVSIARSPPGNSGICETCSVGTIFCFTTGKLSSRMPVVSTMGVVITFFSGSKSIGPSMPIVSVAGLPSTILGIADFAPGAIRIGGACRAVEMNFTL